jgi:hypothetical protein
MLRKITWSLFIFFAIAIGAYPLVYVLFDMSQGLLGTKGADVLQNGFWKFSFYQHIFFGGISLFIGWSQFVKTFRDRFLQWHRRIGKLYLISVILSGTAGLYIALYATGGIISIVGFSSLAISWLTTSVFAYVAIRIGNVDDHQFWMIRSYAVCFAAVMLRIWLPLFQFAFDIDFLTAYRIIAWLCWVPNLIVAELIIRNIRLKQISLKTDSVSIQ